MGKTGRDPALDAFLQWMQDNGVTWEEHLQIVGGTDPGGRRCFSVRARKALTEDQIVCVIPKSCVLSSRNTGIADAIAEAELGGGMALTLALMFEMALGQRSRWAPYLGVCPDHEPTLLYWSREELAELEGTELEGQGDTDRDDLASDFREHVEPLISQCPALQALPAAKRGLEAYTAAASLVASRAFRVDDWHGDAMVPLADMFNHKTAAEHIHFIEEDSDDDDDEEDGGEEDKEGGEEDEDEDEDEEMGPDGPVGSENLAFTVVRPCGKGEEVFNTYGETSTGSLVHKYAFADLLDNPFNVVNLDVELVDGALERHASPKQLRAGRALLRRYEDLLGEPPYFELRAGGSVDPELLLRLHAFFAEGSAREKLEAALGRGEGEDVELEDGEAMGEGARAALLSAIAAREARYPPGGREAAERRLAEEERPRRRAALMVRAGELLVLERARGKLGGGAAAAAKKRGRGGGEGGAEEASAGKKRGRGGGEGGAEEAGTGEKRGGGGGAGKGKKIAPAEGGGRKNKPRRA